MDKLVNAEKQILAPKPHYSVKAAGRRLLTRIMPVLHAATLSAALRKPSPANPVKPISAVRPITLKLGASRRLSLLLLAIALMAQLALLTLAFKLPLPLPWYYILLVWMLASLLLGWQTRRALRQHAWRQSPDAVVLLALNGMGEFSLTLRDGRQLPASLQDHSVVFASFSLLNFRWGEGKVRGKARGKTSCLILPDAVDADEFRRLRVWLRWGLL